MTTDRDFDGIAMAWLADGPEELPDRVIDAAVDQIHLTRQRRAVRAPWRLPTMTTPLRAAAAAVFGVLVFGGALLFLGRPGQPAVGGPSASPPASVAPTSVPSAASTVPALTREIASARHGYSIHVPADWTLTPATAQWTTGIDTLYDDPGLDRIGNAEVRLAVASEPLGTRTPEEWIAPYCRSGATGNACGRKVVIGNTTGYVDEDGKPAEGGTVASGGVIYDAAVAADGRGYIFILDGHVDDALFEAVLKTVVFDGPDAIDLPPLTGTFTSPTNGFSIGTAADWSPTTATTRWHGLGNPSDAMDGIDISGTDSSFGGASQPLGKQTFDDYLAAYHTDSIRHVPGGCDGGDPASWPEIKIGDRMGRLQVLCNAADAFVEAGGRVYIFEWGSQTFDTTRHLSLQSWKALLESVVLTPGAAKP